MSGNGTGVEDIPDGGGTPVAPVGIAVGLQTPNREMHGSNKPPLFEGAFELCRSERELYLVSVIAGMLLSEQRQGTLQIQLCNYNLKNEIGPAFATILRGLRGCQNDDATKVCSMTTATEMWESVVFDKTQRYIFDALLLRRQLTSTHITSASMVQYLNTMESLRQQLLNMSTEHIVTDAEMARLL